MAHSSQHTRRDGGRVSEKNGSRQNPWPAPASMQLHSISLILLLILKPNTVLLELIGKGGVFRREQASVACSLTRPAMREKGEGEREKEKSEGVNIITVTTRG